MVRVLLALCVIAIPIPPELFAQSGTRIMTCTRDGRDVFCDDRPYVKRKVPQPTKRWNRRWER
jgi:hypothetical protein